NEVRHDLRTFVSPGGGVLIIQIPREICDKTRLSARQPTRAAIDNVTDHCGTASWRKSRIQHVEQLLLINVAWRYLQGNHSEADGRRAANVRTVRTSAFVRRKVGEANKDDSGRLVYFIGACQEINERASLYIAIRLVRLNRD